MTDIALLGFGNVGRGFARYLLNSPPGPPAQTTVRGVADVTGGLYLHSPDRLSSVLRIVDEGRQVGNCASHGRLVSVAEYVGRLADFGVTVLVECMPTNLAGGQPALGYLQAALNSGIHVVTVDKGPVVHGHAELRRAAAAAGVRLAFTGTIGVRPPAAIQAGQVAEITGVLNGTTNFILSEMLERSLPFADALALAQASGIAEPDPALDIEGWDTAAKLLILAQEFMNAQVRLGDIPRLGLGAEANQMIRQARASECAVRLIGRAVAAAGGAHLSVAPELVEKASPFYDVSGVRKGALFRTNDGIAHFSAGYSGRDAIARVILDDIAAVVA